MSTAPSVASSVTGLVAHWPFETDLSEQGSASSSSINHNVVLAPSRHNPAQQAAHFNGENSFLEIPEPAGLNWGTDDFSLSVWIETDEQTDIVGDIASQFDFASRRGWSLSAVTNTGVTSTAQANYRHLHFGIDNGVQAEEWTDCGRLGNAVFIYSLATVNGSLYAGTFEMEAGQTGHLWRYAGADQAGAGKSGEHKWEHVGATPDGSSAIPSIVAFEGALYCSTGRYNPVGSRLGPPKNTKPGGGVYRVEADGQWIYCGHPGSEDAVPESTPTSGYETGKADVATALTVYRGKLYTTSFHRRGVYVYEGGQNWKYVGLNERLMSFTIYRDKLYALSNGGPLYRYEGGEEWTFCGTPGNSDQTYAAVTHKGELLVGTWPECEVQRYDGGEQWTNIGRVGYEREVMAMALYNAKVYLGSLPMANVWRLDEDDFTYMGNIDNSPEVFLRRVWSMAVFEGKLFAGTLPSGRVLSFEAGRMATHDTTLPAGRQHVAAVRAGDRLRLYLNGQEVAQSAPFNSADFDLTNNKALKIGFGPHDYFKGAMSDLRLYNRALSPQEIAAMAS